jgi:H/ACA ribonucleoprotein complex subunit 3
MKHILKCTACSAYTLKDKCACGGIAGTPKPAKFSPEDPYGEYRRRVKHNSLGEKGLL